MEQWELRWLDYYGLLGLEPDAMESEINDAYRYKAQILHPDHTRGLPEGARLRAEEEFKQVNEAYDTLRDPERRAVYDSAHRMHRASQDSSTSTANRERTRASHQQEGRQENRQYQEESTWEGEPWRYEDAPTAKVEPAHVGTRLYLLLGAGLSMAAFLQMSVEGGDWRRTA